MKLLINYHFLYLPLCVVFAAAAMSCSSQVKCPENSQMHSDILNQQTEYFCIDKSEGFRTGPFLSFHANKIISCKGQYHQSLKHGAWSCWYDNGAKYTDTDYVDGQKQGRFYLYTPSGQPDVLSMWQLDKLHGRHESYDKLGRLEMVDHFVNGQLNGVHEEYDSNGRLRVLGQFLKGQAVGKWIEYDETGQIKP